MHMRENVTTGSTRSTEPINTLWKNQKIFIFYHYNQAICIAQKHFEPIDRFQIRGRVRMDAIYPQNFDFLLVHAMYVAMAPALT